MISALLLLAQLVLPGLALNSLLRLPGPRFLHAAGLSLSYFVLLFALGRAGQWSTTAFNTAYLSGASFIMALALIRIHLHKLSGNLNNFQQIPRRRFQASVIVILATVLFLYLTGAGPYLEIPSDALAHLKFMQIASHNWLTAADLSQVSASARYMNSHTWYDLVAYSLLLSHSNPGEASAWLHLLTVPLFLFGVYSFATFLYGDKRHATGQKVAFGAISSILVAVHFGVSIFSFIRYYALAPSILNLVVYFAAMVLVLDLFRQSKLRIPSLLALVAYFLTMLILHTQEALFLAVMALLLALYYSFAGKTVSASPAGPWSFPVRQRHIAFVTGISLIAMVSGWYYAHHELAIKSGYLPHIRPIVSFGHERYFILEPSNKFYQALSHWGVAVYFLFLVYFRRFLTQPYLLMGMLSPLVTVFNPLFVDLFIRFYSDNTLWRFAYLVPVHLSAAHIMLVAWDDMTKPGISRKTSALASIGILIVLLLPLSTGDQTWTNNRYLTLQKVDNRNSPAYLSDLTGYLATLPGRESIMTDPVTAYVISAMTKHDAPSHKFFPSHGYRLNRDSYDNSVFADRRNQLLIINERPGNTSKTGQIARHWRSDILDTRKYYSAALLDYVESNPSQFKRLWQRDRILIYRIQ